MAQNSTIIVRRPNQDEQKRKEVCLEQLAQDRQRILVRWPFIGGIIMRMELVPVRDDRLETASTDGDSIFVDIAFYSKLSKDERLFVLAHEVWHSVLLHFARRGARDRMLFNVAADLEIHFMLLPEKMAEPYVLPHDPAWAGLSAEEIYERLEKKSADKEKLSNGGKASPSFGSGTTSFDKHVYKGDGPPEELEVSDSQADGDGSEEALVIDKDYTPAVTAESVERSRSRTIAAAQQLERTQGKLPSNLQKIVEMLEKPSLPWQELLRQFVTTCYGGRRRWLPPARRHVWQDLYLPSMRDERLKAVVALDTSGSTAGDLKLFFAELVSLMTSFGQFDLDVIQCDAKVQEVQHFSDANPPAPDHPWEVRGLGGTDFRPVFDYVRTKMREKPDLLLYFTDGYGTAPDRQPGYPVMWVLTKDGRPPCGWGRVAHFKKET